MSSGNNANTHKKQRLNNEDLWDDDLDENTVEECFFLASQALSQSVAADVQQTTELPSHSKAQSSSKMHVQPSSFKPKQPSRSTSGSFTRKVPSEKFPRREMFPQTDIFPRKGSPPIPPPQKTQHSSIYPKKVPPTLSQSDTFPSKDLPIPTKLDVFPRKSSKSPDAPSFKLQSVNSVASTSRAMGPPNGSIMGALKDPAQDYNRSGVKDYGSREQTPARSTVQKPGRTARAVLDTSMLSKPSVTSSSVSKSEDKDELIRQYHQMKMQNKNLQENLLTRDGEVSILRAQMEALKSEIDRQRLLKMQEIEEQAANYREKVKNLEKELEQKATLLEFKTLEAGNAEERCRLLESRSKVKLVEPQSSKASETFIKMPVPQSVLQERKKPEPKRNPIIDEACIDKKKDESVRSLGKPESEQQIALESEGYMLSLEICPHIFEPQKHGLLPTKDEKPTRCRVYGGNLTPLGYSVSIIYRELTRLMSQTDLEDLLSKSFIDQIVWKCYCLLRVQLELLKHHPPPVTVQDADDLDWNVNQEAGKIYQGSSHILSARQWFENEQSVEIRRTLGLLAVLTLHSNYAAEYMSGMVRWKKYYSLYLKKPHKHPLDRRRFKQVKCHDRADTSSSDLEEICKRPKGPQDKKRQPSVKCLEDSSSSSPESEISYDPEVISEEDKKKMATVLKKLKSEKKKKEQERREKEKAEFGDVHTSEEEETFDPRRPLSPESKIRNYVLRCKKLGRHPGFHPLCNLKKKPRVGSDHKPSTSRGTGTSDRTDAGGSKDKNPGRNEGAEPGTVKCDGFEAEGTKRRNKKEYLMHPMRWNTVSVKDAAVALGTSLEPEEFEYTEFKKELDEKAKLVHPGLKLQKSRLEKLIEKLKSLERRMPECEFKKELGILLLRKEKDELAEKLKILGTKMPEWIFKKELNVLIEKLEKEELIEKLKALKERMPESEFKIELGFLIEVKEKQELIEKLEVLKNKMPKCEITEELNFLLEGKKEKNLTEKMEIECNKEVNNKKAIGPRSIMLQRKEKEKKAEKARSSKKIETDSESKEVLLSEKGQSDTRLQKKRTERLTASFKALKIKKPTKKRSQVLQHPILYGVDHPDVVRKNLESFYEKRKDLTKKTECAHVGRPRDFLKLLHMIVQQICDKRFTITFNGILFATVQLLRAMGSNMRIADDRMPVFVDIIRDAILCRPSVNVLIEIIHLLYVLGCYKPLMESLCTGNGPNPYLADRFGLVFFHKGTPRYDMGPMQDVCSFSRSSCMITLLTYVMVSDRADAFHYAHLGIYMIGWLSSASRIHHYGLSWIGPLHKKKEVCDCQCRNRVIEALVMLLYFSYQHLEQMEFMRDDTFKKINLFLGMGIDFFHQMVYFDCDVLLLMANAEGEYQLMLDGLIRNLDNLELSESQKESLKKLKEFDDQHDENTSVMEYNDEAQMLLDSVRATVMNLVDNDEQ